MTEKGIISINTVTQGNTIQLSKKDFESVFEIMDELDEKNLQLIEENEQLKKENNMLKITIGRNEAYINQLTNKEKWTN